MTENPQGLPPGARPPPGPQSRPAGQMVGRYAVRERLGAGGMGVVYSAWDPLLKRTVALKSLSAPAKSDPQGRERLLHEARALSSLSHPAIASVYDVVDSHDQLFIVEEFVAGTSLRDRLTRPIDLDTFLSIAQGCLSALEEADRHGIVHCDIKPDNIVLTEDGDPKILDFGLARRVSPSGEEGPAASRTVSVSAEMHGGTTSYMSPEALVDSRTDARSDIWSLGVVFYEMLAGRHPFRRGSTTATATSILTESPEEPSHVRPSIPSQLNDVVMSMLVKEPSERAGSATDLLSAVRGQVAISRPSPVVANGRRPRVRFVVALAIALVTASAFATWMQRELQGDTMAPGPPVYLAVEPFENLTVDQRVDAFAVGLSQAVGERVAEVDRVYVVAPDTDFHVGARLRGDIQVVVDRLRVNFQVVDDVGTTTGGVVRGGMEELLEMRGELASNVSRILANRFGLEALPIEETAPPVTNPVAYAAYLHGRGYLARGNGGSDVAAAVSEFQRAVESDPAFVPARVGLAEALWRTAGGDEAAAAQARETGRDAVDRDPLSASAHRVHGWILLEAGDADAAVVELSRSFELDPTDSEASRLLAQAQVACGRPGEAEDTLSRAIRAAPDDQRLHRNLGVHLYQRGELARAVVAFERCVELTPGSARGRSNLGGMYFYLGRNDEAIDAYLESIAIQPNYRAFSNIATVYKAEGSFGEAATNYEAALALDDSDYRVWGNVVSAYERLPGKESLITPAVTRAIELAEARLADDPSDATTQSLVAGYYVTAARPDDAMQAAERALELAPADMDVLFNVACVIELLGDRARAIEMFGRAMDAGFPLIMIENEPNLRPILESEEFQKVITNRRALERERSSEERL